MILGYNLAVDEEKTVADLAAKIDRVLKGSPSVLCILALSDVVARSMVEEATDSVEAFASFMSITAKEMLGRRARAQDKETK